MTPKNKRWFPEDVEALREELETATLKEVARRHGLSPQRIQQITGNINRDGGWTKRRNIAKTRELYEMGLSDQQIAKELKVAAATVQTYRRELGIRRPQPKKWDRERLIRFGRYWYEKYGYLGQVDWSPTQALALGHLDRVRRFYKEDGPHVTTVLRNFGSWSEFKRQAGLPPSPSGNAARGLYKRTTKKN